MNEIKIFENKDFGQIRAELINNEPYVMLADVCKALDIANVSYTRTRLKEDGVCSTKVIDSLGREQVATFINESNLYKVIFQSRKPNAEKFTDWVVEEVLPSIRKHGAYMTPEKLEEVLLNPDTLIRLATDLKTEREKRLQAERQLEHKTEVIKGVTDDIDIYTKRNVLNKVVRYKGANFAERWNELYDRFREVYSIDLKARCEGYNLKQQKKKDELSVIKYAEQFGYLDKLYKIALKLYETDINEILKHLQKIA